MCAHKMILTPYNVILNVIKHLKMKNQLKVRVVSEKKIEKCAENAWKHKKNNVLNIKCPTLKIENPIHLCRTPT